MRLICDTEKSSIGNKNIPVKYFTDAVARWDAGPGTAALLLMFLAADHGPDVSPCFSAVFRSLQ